VPASRVSFGESLLNLFVTNLVLPGKKSGANTEGIAGNLQQFSSQRSVFGAQLLADDHKAARAVPAQELQGKLPTA
jgi:hypothetical protein